MNFELLYIAPPAPPNFAVASATPTTITVTWTRPLPLNGEFGLYEIRYAPEDSFFTSPTETPLFSERFVIRGVSVGVVYRIAVRASTRSLTGELLWGAFSMLRVRDGKERGVSLQPNMVITT